MGFRSATDARSAVSSSLFVLAAVVSYYFWQWRAFGYLPQRLVLAWGLLSLTAVPVFAVICHQVVRESGWLRGFAVGTPVGVLAAECVPRLLNGGVIAEWVLADLVGIVLLVGLGLWIRVSPWRLVVAVAVVTWPAYLVLQTLWSAVGGVTA